MEDWLVARVRLREKGAFMAVLSELNVEVYFPEIVKKGVKKALFPTYMFCQVDQGSDIWLQVKSAPGLVRFVHFGEEFPTVPQDVIEDLRQRVSRWNEEGPGPLERGDKVVVAGGPFADFEGVFEKSISGGKRCEILLRVLGRFVSVELAEAAVEKKR